jgi:hypothetical protein
MTWRILFAAAGVLMVAGGPRHPGGSMLEMLRHPDWFMAHALVTLGYGTMLAGLVAFARTYAKTPAMKRWTRLAIVGTALQALEMAVHTAAMVDAEHLAAGHATPVLTTHLAMSMVFYPLFGVTSAAFFVKGMRERAIGSPWFVWIGVIGTLANGIAPILVGLFGWMEARILFAFMIGIAIWLLLAAVWPTFARQPQERRTTGGPLPAANSFTSTTPAMNPPM